MFAAFQIDAFQANAFQIGALVTAKEERNSGGYWPDYGYVRKKRVSRETVSQEQYSNEQKEQLAVAREQILARREQRRKELRDRYVVSEIKALYAEQDALLAKVSLLKQTIAEEEDDLALILALVS
jgi:ribosomal protein L9